MTRSSGAGREAPSALDGVLPLLACPHCSAMLERRAGPVVGCRSGHRFDVARQGYLSLLGARARTDTGDSAEMVAARVSFLGAGHYRSIAAAIADLVEAGPVLEVGAGTGYYVTAVVERLLDRDPTGPGAVGLALDASRYAARRAAAAHPRIGSIVADAWSRLPVLPGATATVLSVFAPRDPAEIARVLTPGGRVVVVTPEPDHLIEIRAPLGMLTVDAGKADRLAEAFAGRLRVVERVGVTNQLQLTRDDLTALVGMGPAARHVPPDRLRAAVTELDDVTAVTLAVNVTILGA